MATEAMNKGTQAQPVARAERRPVYTPPVDIIETPDGLRMLLDMPGVEPGDIDIQYENGVLTIEGKVQPRKREGVEYLLCEYGVGDYFRSFALGEGIDANKIEASFDDGVMTLTLPKAEALKPRKIEIKS